MAGAEASTEASALVPVNEASVGAAGDPSGMDEARSFHLPYTRLPVDLQVAVPVRNFRVCDLLGIVPGSIYETQWGSGDDLPLNAGEVQIAWVEFEVVNARLAVRVTRLA